MAAQLATKEVNNFSSILNLDFRDVIRHPQDISDVDISGHEILHVLSLFDPYGLWRLNLETSEVFWSEDVFAIHGLPFKEGPPDLEAAIDCYHPDDQEYLPKLIEESIARKSGFRFVLRLKRRVGGYKLVKSTGKYRESIDGRPEMIGTFSEFQPANRAIAAIG